MQLEPHVMSCNPHFRYYRVLASRDEGLRTSLNNQTYTKCAGLA